VERDEASAERTTPVAPGALSALLRQLAADPVGSFEADWQLGLQPGQEVGRFRLVREIGRGGFGVVFEAEDPALGRRVALKAVRTGGRAGLREERLLREAEAAARLSHPAIVTLFDVGRTAQGPYLVLELLEGETLAARCARGPMSVREAVGIAGAVTRALAHAHERGVVHRDLKPANVFLCAGGAVKVLDFGLAHAFGHRRIEGGTPAYMAPEQAAGAPEDERTDVFAIGVLLFRMLTGRLPFGDLRGDVSLSGPDPAPAFEVPRVPELGELVARMLEKDPVRRPRDGVALLPALAEVERALEGEGGPGPVRVTRRRGRRMAALVALGTLVGGGAVGGALLLREGRIGSPAAPDGRIVVAVADFVNLTGDPDLDSLSGLLITSMEQSRRLSVLTQARMADLARQAGKPDPERIDEILGRELCRRAVARALLLPTIRRLGSVYAVELRALDPSRDSYLFALQERSESKEGLLAAVDRLSDGVRRGLHEPEGEVAAARSPVAEVVTGDLVAYRHYQAAQRHLSGLRYAEAAAELKKALEAQPGFALAHHQLARMGTVGEITREEQQGHLARALALRDRLPAKERRILLAWNALSQGRAEEGEAGYRALSMDFPDDKEVALELGTALFDADRVEEAVPHLRRATRLDPASISAGAQLQDALGWLGRSAEALELARQASRILPGPQTLALEANALLWAGEHREAARLAGIALDQGEQVGRAIRMNALVRLGDLEAVEAEAAVAVASSDAGLRQQGRMLLAAACVSRGLRRRALGLIAASAEDAARYPAYYSRWRLALLVGLGEQALAAREAARLGQLDADLAGRAAAPVAWDGDLEVAARLARALRPGSGPEALYRAAVAWRQGRKEEALPALERLAATRASGTYLDVLYFAEASLQSGEAARAAAELRRFQRLPTSAQWAGWAVPRSQLLLARAEEVLGHREAAAAEAARLAALWREADPGYGPAEELRALRARLSR
jgi:hypothetical protein